MNRLWHHHFGRGVAATPGNLGRSGSPPTHPELLDHLAAEFVRGGWKFKPVHKLIVLSSAYRQAAHAAPGDVAAAEKADPENMLLWHTRLRRLESEAVRDAILTVSGRLDRRVAAAAKPADRVALAFRLALCRVPTSDEATAATALLEKHARRYADLPADEAAVRALAHLCHVLLCTNEFLYVE